MRRILALVFTVVLALVFEAPEVLAQPAPADLESPRGMALGTGVRAGSWGNDALAYNPANMPLLQLYHLGAFTGYGLQARRWMPGASVTDSSTLSGLAAGLSFRGALTSRDSSYEGVDGRLALAIPIAEVIGLGASVRYLSLSTDDERDPRNHGRVRGFTVDAAARLTPTKGFHIAALGQNLVDRNSPLAPRLVGGSLAFGMLKDFSFGGDVLVDLSDPKDRVNILGGGGLEYVLFEVLPLRAGYKYHSGRNVHTVTGGIGFTSQSFSSDLALRQDVHGSSQTELLMELRYHVR